MDNIYIFILTKALWSFLRFTHSYTNGVSLRDTSTLS